MPSLMIQGTTSDAGKSLAVAALCRIFQQEGFSVAPFKPQNMALNAFVTKEGGEIGRAQAFQAFAAKVEPEIDMNPVLIKPTSDTNAQIIVQGQVAKNMDAKSYQNYKEALLEKVLESYQRLQKKYDLIFVEGAGSPAEINLRHNDLANMGFACAVNLPVLLIADIDRGGVFAHLVGTLELLEASEQDLVKGFIINKFRGDKSLLLPGNQWLEQKTQKPVLGVIPYIEDLIVEPEDAIETKDHHSDKAFHVVVLVYPHISNHSDFDPLRLNPNIHLEFIHSVDAFKGCDLFILPGSKSVIDDLQWLFNMKWDQIIYQHLRYQGKVIGLCGGYQMLGQKIYDPYCIESQTTEQKGLGLLPISTQFEEKKQLKPVLAKLFNTIECQGYEMHHGRTQKHKDLASVLYYDDQHEDGLISEDNQILGCYLHGIFENKHAQSALLHWANCKNAHVQKNYADLRDQQIDKLADTFRENLSLASIFQYLNLT